MTNHDKTQSEVTNTGRLEANEEPSSQADQLQQRVRELDCLYRMSDLIEQSETLDEILERVVELIPLASKYPEETSALILLEGREVRTGNHDPQGPVQQIPVMVHGCQAGCIEYTCPIGSFQETHKFLRVIAERLGRVTERVRAEQTSITGEVKYRSLVANLNEGIWAINPDARTTFVNPRMAQMLGYQPEEMIGRHIYDFMDNKLVGDAKKNIDGRQVETREIKDFIFVSHDGRQVITTLRTAPILSPEGEYQGALATVTDVTGHKKTEDDLRSSDDRFRHIIESNVDGILIIDDAGQVLFANPAAQNFLGKSHHNLVGTNFGFPVVRDKAAAIEIWDGQDGVRTAEMSTVRIKWNGGQATLASLRDISQRKEIEAALQKSEEKYRLLADHTLDVIWAMNMELVFTYVNPAITQLTGHTPEEWIGSQLSEHCDNENFNIMVEVVAEALGGGPDFGAVIFEAEMLRKDGSTFFVQIHGQVIYDETDTPIALQGITSDITEKKMAEKQLKASEERLRKLLDSLSACIVIIDPETRKILDLNPAAAKLTGLSREDAIGRSCRGLICPVREGPCPVSSQGQEVKNQEHTIITADDREVPVIKTVVPIDLDGREVFLETFSDISQLKELENQLHHAQKMEAVGRLAGGVAHDFNNILTTIIGTSKLILGDLTESDPLTEDILEITTAAERAADLTRQLLTFSRKQMQELKVLNLNKTISSLSKMLIRLIGEDVNLETSLAPDLGNIKADPGQMEQVIMNLAVNARDAMPKGGALFLETSNIHLDEHYQLLHPVVNPGPYVLLTITDTGVGMDEDTQKRIFEPFYTTKGIGKGTGLGLAMVYGIVKQNNGYIWVYSEIGRGTTFKIYLPAVDAPAQSRPIGKVSGQGLTGDGTILVVEDEAVVSKLIGKALTKSGFKVVIASSAKEALNLVRDLTPDLILTDVVMPDMNGPELIDLIRKTQPDVKVLFMSGYTEHASFKNGSISLKDNFIHKPFSPNSLITKIVTVLEG